MSAGSFTTTPDGSAWQDAPAVRNLTYRITTLGCRVNHAETREIDAVLRSRGLTAAAGNEPVDLEVVHTCSVTNVAAAKSRQQIRRAVRRARAEKFMVEGSESESRTAEVLVTGCYASTNPRDAAEVAAGPDRVIPHETSDSIDAGPDSHPAAGSSFIERFALRVDEWISRRFHGHATGLIRNFSDSCCNSSPEESPILRLPIADYAGPVDSQHAGDKENSPHTGRSRHIRAELKIQDGCDAHCTFCIIPKIRRTLRSKTIDDTVTEARRLADLGHREIVLTGIFIGAYGHETALRRRQSRRSQAVFSNPLADLLDAVAQVPGLERLRISSMEPGDVDQQLLDAMVANDRVVVPHLHLPLQSGSDDILRRMNRQYRVGDYMDMIEHVHDRLTRDRLPPAITTDIICGFPGETEDDFQKTVEIARRVGYLHMHVFPFSPRRGTAAARWTDRFVDPAEVRRRVRTLIDMENDPDNGLSVRFRRRLIGRRTRVIVEQCDPRGDHDRPGRGGWVTGRCDHYVQVRVPAQRPRGALLEVLVREIGPDQSVIAVPVGTSVRLPVLTV